MKEREYQIGIELSDRKWKNLILSCQSRRVRRMEGKFSLPIGLVSKGCLGFCGAEHATKIYRNTFRPVVPALAAIDVVVRTGSLIEGLADHPRTARPKRTIEVGRRFCRGHICLCNKGGQAVGKTKRGKGTKIMVLTKEHGTPMAALLGSASVHEVKLIESTVKQVRIPRRGRPKTKVKRLIDDKAADSDPLRMRLKKRRIDLITPYRKNRVKPPMQDARTLRRYHRRWKIERTIAWIQNFRRLVVRYDRKIEMFQAQLQLACTIIAVKKYGIAKLV
jgi:transposase